MEMAMSVFSRPGHDLYEWEYTWLLHWLGVLEIPI
jgi:hypothetical protein